MDSNSNHNVRSDSCVRGITYKELHMAKAQESKYFGRYWRKVFNTRWRIRIRAQKEKTNCCTVYVVVLCVCIAVFTLDAGLLARSQYSEGPATGHLDTGFSRFPCAYKQMLRRFPTFQVATTCFSCSTPDLNLVVTKFMFCLHVK